MCGGKFKFKFIGSSESLAHSHMNKFTFAIIKLMLKDFVMNANENLFGGINFQEFNFILENEFFY